MSQQIPDRNNPLGLFEYSVRRVIQLNLMGKINTHQVWANYIFKSEKNPEVRKDLMSIVKHAYSQYFSEDLQYMFLEEKINQTDYIEFFLYFG